MGVAMLPRLAAMVWRLTTGMMRSRCPTRSSTSRAKGTKVMRATSLVTAMLVRKGRKISTPSSCRVEAVRESTIRPSRLNTPSPRRPVITAIRANSSPSVSKSM